MNSICAYFKKKRSGFSLDASIYLDSGKVTAFLGTSGSGKTTLLRLLAGLEKADEGEIRIGDDAWLNTRRGFHLSVQERKVGFLFQDYALFSHLTVADNIGYGVAKAERDIETLKWLRKLELEKHAHAYPHELSGGQRQRVALGRALAIKPNLLLLDEPFSALDISLKAQLQNELKNYLREIHCPIVLVTHDLSEARRLADQIYVIHEGEIIRAGSVESVFTRPHNRQAARTLGWTNFLPIQGVDANVAYGSWGLYHLDHHLASNAAYLAFQPQHVRLNSSHSFQGISGLVRKVEDCNVYREISIELDGGVNVVAHRFWDEPIPAPGSMVSINITPSHMQVLAKNEKLIDSFDDNCIFSKEA